MTVQHQSYLELKKDVGEEFARKALLYNLESLKNNIRASAKRMKCSAHTVYLALEKQKKGNLKDSSHKPKSKHPRYIEEEKEQMIIEYRKKSLVKDASDTISFKKKVLILLNLPLEK